MGIGAGANVVGGIMQTAAAGMAQKAMYSALARELQRQQGHRNEALGAFQGGTEQRSAETANQQVDAGAQKREAKINQVGGLTFGLGQPNLMGRDKAAYKLKGMSRARLGGYSDWALDQMISNLRTQDQLNKISNFAGGDAQVFPYRMYDAQHSGDELAFWGSLISSIGGSSPAWGQMFGQAPGAAMGGQQGASGGLDAGQGFGQQFSNIA